MCVHHASSAWRGVSALPGLPSFAMKRVWRYGFSSSASSRAQALPPSTRSPGTWQSHDKRSRRPSARRALRRAAAAARAFALRDEAAAFARPRPLRGRVWCVVSGVRCEVRPWREEDTVLCVSAEGLSKNYQKKNYTKTIQNALQIRFYRFGKSVRALVNFSTPLPRRFRSKTPAPKGELSS